MSSIKDKLPYLNKYMSYKNNTYLDKYIKEYLEVVLRTNSDYYIPYLKEKRYNHKYKYFMHILEEVTNYIIHLMILTRIDFFNNKKNKELSNYILKTFDNLKARYKKLILLYQELLNESKTNIVSEEKNKLKRVKNKKR